MISSYTHKGDVRDKQNVAGLLKSENPLCDSNEEEWSTDASFSGHEKYIFQN